MKKQAKSIEEVTSVVVFENDELLNIKGGRSDSGDREDLLIVE